MAWAVIPGVSLAAALALGAVVSPPDAVAATTIARRVGMPRRIVSILEGESLLNDATALVALRTTIAAIAATVTVLDGRRRLRARRRRRRASSGWPSPPCWRPPASGSRTRCSTRRCRWSRRSSPTSPPRRCDASGVLAVVIVGLLLGHKSPALQSASSRLAEQTNWRTITFVLENAVFLLIGLQVPQVVRDATGGDFGDLPAGPDLRAWCCSRPC